MVGHRRETDELAWRPFGTESVSPVAAHGGSVKAFVLPDSGGLPKNVLRSATDRIRLAAYTLTSRRVVEALGDAATRGLDVRVLVEGGPVGGMSRRQARLLDTLVTRSNVSVDVMTGPHARYRFHHAKYAVVDDRALVLTENWKPAGTGGRSSRGWGVLLDQRPVVDGLADLFAADTGWYDTTPWTAFRRGRQFNESVVATGDYPRTVAPETVPADRVQLLTAPDNAEREILDRLQSATESIRIVQVSIGSRNHPFLKATLGAARRGVDVQLLLSRAWYAKEENRALVTWLQQRAATENLSLAARLARPRTRYEKIHAKGVVVDGQHVVLGSPNWNNNSLRNNREVAVALDGRKIGAYYASVFSADWEASAWRAPLSLFGVLGISVGIVCYRLRELQFE
jgi:phosphatidylserine/phosphatidylglycerophosphate/cardiolipin synthase-like enzyme